MKEASFSTKIYLFCYEDSLNFLDNKFLGTLLRRKCPIFFFIGRVYIERYAQYVTIYSKSHQKG